MADQFSIIDELAKQRKQVQPPEPTATPEGAFSIIDQLAQQRQQEIPLVVDQPSAKTPIDIEIQKREVIDYPELPAAIKANLAGDFIKTAMGYGAGLARHDLQRTAPLADLGLVTFDAISDAFDRGAEFTAETLAQKGVNPTAAASIGLTISMIPDLALVGAANVGTLTRMNRAFRTFARQRLATRSVKVPVDAQDIKTFFTHGKENLRPEVYEILVKQPKDKLRKLAEQAMKGESAILEARIPRDIPRPVPAAPPSMRPAAEAPLVPVRSRVRGVPREMRPEFQQKIEPVRASLDPKLNPEQRLRGTGDMVDFVAKNPNNMMPAEQLALVKGLENRFVPDLSLEERRAINNTMQHIEKLNAIENQVHLAGRLQEFEDIKTAVLQNINKRQTVSEEFPIIDSFQKQKQPGPFKKFLTSDSYNMELDTEILEGMDQGPLMRVMFEELDDGVSIQLAFEHRAKDFFDQQLQGLNVEKWSHAFQANPKNIQKVTINLPSGKSISMTPAERIAIAMHMQNRNNLRHLQEGGFAFSRNPTNIIKLPPEDLQAVAISLTPEESRVLQAARQYYDTLQPQAINQTSTELLGYEVAREPNYFPIRTHWMDRRSDALLKTRNYTQKTLEGLGMFKPRQRATNSLILDDVFVALSKSMKNTAAYHGLAKPLRSAKMLLNDKDFQMQLQKAGRSNYASSMRTILERIEDQSTNLENVERLTQKLINRLDVFYLGANPWVMMKQPVSFLLAFTEIDPKYLTRISYGPISPAEMAEMRQHPQLRDRMAGNVTRELGELAQVGEAKKFFTNKEVLSNKFMEGIRKFDMLAIGRIWRAAKAEAQDLYPQATPEQLTQIVGNRAWQVIRRTQPTFHVKDRSPIGSSPSLFLRLGTKYSSQRNKNWMILRRAYEKYQRSNKTAQDKAKLAARIASVTLVAPLMLAGINEMRNIAYGRKQKKRAFKFATDILRHNIGNIYFLGEGFDSLVSKIEKGTYAGYDIETPFASTLNDIVNTNAEAIRAVKFAVANERYRVGKKRGEEKWKTSVKNLTRNSMDLVGQFTGIPIRTIRQLLKAAARPFVEEPPRRQRPPGAF